MAEGQRAESEASLICSATPIMPIDNEQAIPDAVADPRWGEEYEDRAMRPTDYDPMDLMEEEYGTHAPASPTPHPHGDGHPDGAAEPKKREVFWFDNDGADPWVPPNKFEDSIGRFKAYYMGSVPVRDFAGPAVVKDAAQRLRKLPQDPKDVTCVISPQSVSLVERYTGDFCQHDPLQHVTYSLLDPRDGRFFSYITHKPGQGFAHCHILKFYAHADKVAPAMAMAMRECVKVDATEQAHDLASQALVEESARRDKSMSLNTRSTILSKRSEITDPRAIGVFDAKFLGAVPVTDDNGNDVCLDALDELFYEKIAATETPEYFDDWTDINSQNAVVTVTPDSVRVDEFLTGEELDNHFHQNITFTTFLDSSPDENLRHDIFCIISKDECLGRMACYAFKTAPGMARDLCKAVSAANKKRLQAAAANTNPLQVVKANKNTRIINLFKDQLDRGDLEMHEAIGAGQYGPVFRATQTMILGGEKKQFPRAVKFLLADATQAEEASFVRELLSLQGLVHENIVRMVAVNVLHYPFLVVLDLAEYGELRKALLTADDKGVVLHLSEQLYMANQIASGMGFLASQGRVHMNLQLKNVLLRKDCRVEICGLSACRQLDEGKTQLQMNGEAHVRLPLRWRAIENFEQNVYSSKSDVWAYGVTLWEMFNYGAVPYRNTKTSELRRKIGQDNLRLKPLSQFACPDDVFQLIQSCWHTNPDDRLSFNKLIEATAMLLAASKEKEPEIRDIGAVIQAAERQVRNTEAKPEWLTKKLRQTKNLSNLLARDRGEGDNSGTLSRSKRPSWDSGAPVATEGGSRTDINLGASGQLKDQVISPWREALQKRGSNTSLSSASMGAGGPSGSGSGVPMWKQLLLERRRQNGSATNDDEHDHTAAPSLGAPEPAWLSQLKRQKSKAIFKTAGSGGNPNAAGQQKLLRRGMSLATSLVAPLPEEEEEAVVETLKKEAQGLLNYADKAVIDRAMDGETIQNPLFFDEEDEEDYDDDDNEGDDHNDKPAADDGGDNGDNYVEPPYTS